MTPELVLLLASSMGAYLAHHMRRYSVTSHGENPWTAGALVNSLVVSPHVERLLGAIDGSINSFYRSERVNQIVGGENNSRHKRGLALDAAPGARWTMDDAFAHAAAMARRGELGPVRLVLHEGSWLHVDWYGPGEAVQPVMIRRMDEANA